MHVIHGVPNTGRQIHAVIADKQNFDHKETLKLNRMFRK